MNSVREVIRRNRRRAQEQVRQASLVLPGDRSRPNNIDLHEVTSVVVLQFGKVGSCTLRDTFRDLGKKVTHTHWIGDPSLDAPGHTLVVTPVQLLPDRNLSSFFQNARNKTHPLFYMGDSYNSLTAMVERYRNVAERYFEHCEFESWFSEYNARMGVNVLAGSFDKELGYKVVRAGNRSIVLMRFEDIGRWPDILSKLFGRNIQLTCSNVTSEKPNYSIYKAMQRMDLISSELKERMAAVDFVRFFYG